VLEHGHIAERGTHPALLAKGGLYASMWNRQREAEEAREKLAQIDDSTEAPNRNPPLAAAVVGAAVIEAAQIDEPGDDIADVPADAAE